MRKKLGIAGGLGPLASAVFYEQITRLTCAANDQEHLDLILYSAPSIPDRSAFLTGQSGESPFPALLDVCGTLAELTDLIAIPCVTAHHFYDELAGALPVPLVNMLTVCADRAAQDGVCELGLLATDGTLLSGRLESVLREYGIKTVVPDKPVQREVMKLIYGVKAGLAPDNAAFEAVCSALRGQGVQKLLLACTELSLYKRDEDTYDASELLARYCIKAAGGVTLEECTKIS